MGRFFGDAEFGRKNIILGVALFLALGVVVGIPLTVNFLGGSMLTSDQYGTWKVIHGYGIFLGLINYFFGLTIDRLQLTRQQKQVSSWSFVIAGLIGGAGRPILMLLSALAQFGIFVSLGETVFITLGTAVFLLGQMRGSASGRTS
jgi:hypothetical protein